MPQTKKTKKNTEQSQLIDLINKKFEGFDKRFDSVDKRFDSVDKRFDSVDKRFEEIRTEMTSGFDGLEHKVNVHSGDIIDQQEKIMGALDGVKLALEKVGVFDGHEERIGTLEREMIVVKAAVKNSNL